MKVYIEYVIVDNLVIDAIILYLSLKSAKIRAQWYLVLLGAVLGTLTAIFMPYAESLGRAVLVLLKGACSLLIVLCSARYRSLKKYLMTLLLFYVYTFLLGGICMGILYFLGADLFSSTALAYSYRVPVGVIAGGVFAGYLLLRLMGEYVHRRRAVECRLVATEIFYGGKSVKATGFFDTGNRLYDSATGLPVVLVRASVVQELVGFSCEGDLVKSLKKAHEIRLKTVAGESGKIFLFKPDKLLLYAKDTHTITDVMVGIQKSGLEEEEFSVLLHGSLL